MSEKSTDKKILTALRAARIAEEHWEYIVANGGGIILKDSWPGWHKYGEMRSSCSLCEYTYLLRMTPGGAAMSSAICLEHCPYAKRFGYICTQSSSPFAHWVACPSDETRERLTSAKKFLAQLIDLRQYLEVQEFQSKPPVAIRQDWTIIASYPAGTELEYRVRVDKDAAIFERRESTHPAPKDITGECTVELKKSHHSDGWYVLVKHGDKQLFVLGLDDKSAHLQLPGSKGYQVKKAKNATVSFNIMK